MKKILLCLFLLFSQSFPIQAASKQTILVISDDIPFVIIAEIKDREMQVNMIPSSLTLPLPDVNNYPSTLRSMDMKKHTDSIKNTVSNFYNKDIDHVVYVHMDNLAKDLELNLSEYDMKTMHGITSFFEAAKKNISASMIFKYQSYITSDMGLSQYYDLYKMFKDHVDISYAYASYLVIDDLYIPLDNKLQVQK